MHQVKVMDLPYGKFRDKGQPIDNISNYDSTQEEIVYICDSEQMRYANLLFATKQGMVKKVGGSEFQVTKRTIAATKLQPEDEVVNIRVVTENQHIVLQTADGFSCVSGSRSYGEEERRDRSAGYPLEKRRCIDECISV